MHGWKETNSEEMEAFIGLLLWMGLVKMPSIKCYWQQSKLYRNSVAQQTMTRNRFQLLLKLWHFADNETTPKDDRLHKVRKLVEMLVSRYQKVKLPGENIVVDETMVPFRGRLHFKQYIPGKAHKYGVKLFKMCDEDGYTYNLNVYAGQRDGQPTDVVMKLAEPYLESGRTVCTDSYYTSLPLADSLLQKKTHLVGTLGTLHLNRKGLPADVCKARLKKGEVVARENGSGTVVMKWRDKQDVLLLSTKHTDTMENAPRPNRKGEQVAKPQAVLYYNKAKQGIDVSDQLSSYHSVVRKSIRWYHKVAAELLLGTSVVNACILYNELCVRKGRNVVSIVEFREKIIESLLVGQDCAVPVEPSNKHFLRETAEKEHGKRSDRRKRRYCMGCYNRLTEAQGRAVAKKKAKRVVTDCAGCPNNPRFCFDCFPKFH